MKTGAWHLAAALIGLGGLIGLSVAAAAQTASTGMAAGVVKGVGTRASQPTAAPPLETEAQRFLAERGWTPGHRLVWPQLAAGRAGLRPAAVHALDTTAAVATWQALGPAAVETPNFGLVTGRVSALALDPSDTTGNHLYVGTTGGGVWVTQNADASSLSTIAFTPLTDSVAALGAATDASISIGALTVQPGGTGVILAGTGDPNDVLDSYYGAGILRSADGGATWTLIQTTQDLEDNLSDQDYSFVGEGFAGFAWSTVNPQLVVAAVSQAYEGTVVDADRSNTSYEGLYYSPDSGLTWHLATITDSDGEDVQGPLDVFTAPDGNAATAVVWNPVRQLFVAAVRYHGYYQSADGITWMRMTQQPGSGLTTLMCPTNPVAAGSIACPIFRGALAVNPSTGDTFAWTVDLNNQDQGLWQDQCAIGDGVCSSPALTFAKQWSTAALEVNTVSGAVTIPNGGYALTLAAVPSQQDTLVVAGDDDLWKCSLAAGCVWRNTTNATTCMSARVGAFEHALTWNAANPLEIFVGNDSGLWRSTDAIGETGAACSASDATHFENLNGSLGSLAEVVSQSAVIQTPYTLMAGLGVNGTAGVKSTTATADWPQILGGYGGPVAIDPLDTDNWYANGQAGVAIYRCSQSSACTAADFGTSPVVTDADVGGDGDTMPTPAPFLVDPLDSTQLLVGTCRVWRGPADGSGWSGSNAISPILDNGAASGACNGDALIRSMAALPLTGGSEVVYVGMYGSADDGANLPGHVLSAVIDPSSSTPPVWQDLTLNPVVNDSDGLNAYGLDISSIFIDPHDTTGNTVYVTVEGMENPAQEVQVIYRTTDGGAHWTDLTANLSAAPASSVVVDPQDANTVYVATDRGVYFTTQVVSCALSLSNCWSAFGTGLPSAPAVALSAAPAGASAQVLVAGTYGRGIWQTPLWSAGTALTSAATKPPIALTFPNQVFGVASSAMTVTLENTGSIALAPTSITMSGDFSETDKCVNVSVPIGGSCTIYVTFTPAATGSRSGEMTIFANVYGGQLTVDLSGTGTPAGPAGAANLAPASVDFGLVAVGSTSAPMQVTANNSSGTAIPITSIVKVTSPFSLASNACGSSSLAANSSCQIEVTFSPTLTGAMAGTLELSDGAGIQTVALSGTGAAPPTDTLSTNSLAFPNTVKGQVSAVTSQTQVVITNTGDLFLNFPANNAITVSGPFQVTTNFTTQIAAQHPGTGTISVQFAPTQAGAATGTLTITDSMRTQTVALSGTGLVPPAFSVSQASLTFTNQQPGVASAPQLLTVTNSGGAPLANVGFEITGPAAASYALGTTTCGAVLNNGSSCTAQVIFTPAATGSIAAALAISSSTLGVAAVSVPLNGSGQLTAGLGTNPSQLTFPAVGAGQSSAAQPITVFNSSNYAIGAVTLSVTAPFSLSENTCTSGLAAGKYCTAGVVFAPSAAGSATASLTVTSTAVAQPATVALSGTGYDFSAALSGAGSQTVTSGQQANYALSITPAGTQGTFSFQCGTLPANALCLFNPGTETLASGVQGSVAVEIFTGGSGLSARAERPAGWPALPLACGIVLLPLAFWKRRKALLLVVLAAILSAGVSSCASSGGTLNSSSSGQSSGGKTPPGTYTIPVAISSTGVSHSVSLTLTVD